MTKNKYEVNIEIQSKENCRKYVLCDIGNGVKNGYVNNYGLCKSFVLLHY